MANKNSGKSGKKHDKLATKSAEQARNGLGSLNNNASSNNSGAKSKSAQKGKSEIRPEGKF